MNNLTMPSLVLCNAFTVMDFTIVPLVPAPAAVNTETIVPVPSVLTFAADTIPMPEIAVSCLKLQQVSGRVAGYAQSKPSAITLNDASFCVAAYRCVDGANLNPPSNLISKVCNIGAGVGVCINSGVVGTGTSLYSVA